MNKILFAIPLVALAFTSCDPSVDEISPVAPITADALSQNMAATQESEGNNNIVFYTTPTRYIRVYNAESGDMLGEGTAVKYQDLPPEKTLSYYFETINEDGSLVKSSSKQLTVNNFTKVPQQYAELFGSDYTAKVFGWNVDSPDGVMGNGAYLENGAPGWWKIFPDGIDSQADGWGIPNQGLNATMTISPGSMTTPAGTGKVKFDFSNITKPGWDLGMLTCDGIYPLCGINPNAGAAPFNSYHILKITDGDLNLCAPEPGAGDWGTAWFWCYKRID